MAATWAARCGIHARIIDEEGTKVFNGQADGLQCRSLEIFDSFGFADRAWRESNHILEICLWNPDSTGRIRRTDRTPDTIPGISRFQEVVLHQGRKESFFLHLLKDYSNIEIERGILLEELHVDHAMSTIMIHIPFVSRSAVLTRKKRLQPRIRRMCLMACSEAISPRMTLMT